MRGGCLIFVILGRVGSLRHRELINGYGRHGGMIVPFFVTLYIYPWTAMRHG